MIRYTPVYFISFLIALFFNVGHAQQIENIKAIFNGEDVVVTYDLRDTEPNQLFKIRLFSSYDNFAAPLTKVDGDVGDYVAQGQGRRIIWNIKSSLPSDFKNELTFKVKGERSLLLTKIAIEPFKSNLQRRGKNMEIKWTGGMPQDRVKIEVLRKDAVVSTLAESGDNNHLFAWKIPKKMEKGDDYGIRISKLNTPLEVSNVQKFVVGARYPLVVKLIPVAVVLGGVIVYKLIDGKKSDELPPPIDYMD